MKLRVILETDPETGEWAVWCPELPGCTSAGETEEEALENINSIIFENFTLIMIQLIGQGFSIAKPLRKIYFYQNFSALF